MLVFSCRLERCQIRAASCGDLSSVLRTNQNLIELNLGYNRLKDSGLKFLCEGLNHSNCKLQRIGLPACHLTAACCKELSHVLITNQTLVNLDLTWNLLGNSGTKQLCEVLRHPACKLQSLRLENCNIKAGSGGALITHPNVQRALSSALSTNQNLTKLQLSGNELRDSGLKFLCEGLKHPNCRLKSVG
ncbi:hypothetical protein lerEdw1_005241 [Lerista edwardsae]|nr:hypothetical protein lerEdw1_005241 [Lerista edwardsae]